MAVKLNIPLPSKGLTVDRPGEFVDTRSAANIKNMEFNRAIIRKRIGSTALGTSLGERIQRFFELQIGTSTRLIRVGNTKVEALNKSTGIWADVANTALTGTAVDQVDFAFPVLSGTKIAVFTNGIDNIRKISSAGNDADLGGSPPKGKFIQSFGPYTVVAGISNFPVRVQRSDTALPEVWAGGNSGTNDLLDDPEDITGLGLFGSFLTVHKSNSIYVGQLVTTSAVFRFERRATGVGTAANATIQSLPSGEQIFLAADGLHLFNGVTAPLIDSPAQDELRETLNPEQITKSQAIFVRELDEYWVCVPVGSDTEPQTIYKYNYRTRQVYKDFRAGLTALSVFLNTTADTWDDRTIPWDTDTTRWDSVTNLSLNLVVITGTSTGAASQRTANSNNDDGVAIDGIWETKDFTAQDFGIKDIDRLMRWKELEIWAKGSTMKVEFSIDSGSTYTLATTLTLAADYPIDGSPLNVFFDVVSTKIRFRFSNNILGETFTLKKYLIESTAREARK